MWLIKTQEWNSTKVRLSFGHITSVQIHANLEDDLLNTSAVFSKTKRILLHDFNHLDQNIIVNILWK